MMDLNKMLDICRRCKYLPENELKQLCERICDILISESNVQPVRFSEIETESNSIIDVER